MQCIRTHGRERRVRALVCAGWWVTWEWSGVVGHGLGGCNLGDLLAERLPDIDQAIE